MIKLRYGELVTIDGTNKQGMYCGWTRTGERLVHLPGNKYPHPVKEVTRVCSFSTGKLVSCLFKWSSNPKWKWAAVDRNGQGHFFTHKPTYYWGSWYKSEGEVSEGFTVFSVNYKSSCVSREDDLAARAVAKKKSKLEALLYKWHCKFKERRQRQREEKRLQDTTRHILKKHAELRNQPRVDIEVGDTTTNGGQA